MKSFNLSDWALKHRSLVWYFMLAFVAAGVYSYLQLRRAEDPDFTIKTMVIQAQWPGASAEEITRQVTDRVEKKLEELESLDYTKSVTVAGQTTVFVYLRDSTKAHDVSPTWIRVRNMIADIKGDFPQGVIGPFFNDRFGDVFGNIYSTNCATSRPSSCPAALSRTAGAKSSGYPMKALPRQSRRCVQTHTEASSAATQPSRKTRPLTVSLQRA